MTSRIRPVTVLDEDEEESVSSQSSDVGVTTTMVDRTMESFTQELDSMEQGPDLHEMIERAKSRAEQSHNYNNSNSSAGRGGVSEAYQQQQQKYATDPYASRNRLTEDYRDTPDMRRTGSTPDSRRTNDMTTTPQEPKPVRTPPYQRQSPSSAATPVGYSPRFEGAGDPERGRYESTSRRPPANMQSPTTNGYSKMQSPIPNGYSTTRFEGVADSERERRTSARAQEVNMQSPIPNGYSNIRFQGGVVDPKRENFDRGGGDTNDNQTPLSSVKSILDSMGNTMERQESRIRFLEEENEALRAELEYRKREQRPVPTSTTRTSPHPEPAYSAPPPRSRPANSGSARSPVPAREPWEQNSNSAPPSASRSASKQVRSPMPMPSSPYNRSAPPLRNPGSEPRSYSEQPRHTSPPTRSPRPELWDHQAAPRMRSLGHATYDPPREFTSPTTSRRPEEDVVHHRTFSPGVKFVAELSNVMELEEGLHAPLSAIMDKYWDRIDLVRNGHGWDR
jgi:hypothetical protein